jgi:hypothetical protein
MLVTGLAPDVILVIGEITKLWNKVGPIITKTVTERSLTHAATRIVPTDPVLHPRLLGTVALVLQKALWRTNSRVNLFPIFCCGYELSRQRLHFNGAPLTLNP